jgi:hypothetical protein
LYPFLKKEALLKIFGKDIFENKKLLQIMKALVEQGRPKPFECVGAKKESQLAFCLSLEKAKKSGTVPYLLTKAVLSRLTAFSPLTRKSLWARTGSSWTRTRGRLA